MRHRLPHGRQRVDRVEHTGEHGQRHDEKVLKGRELVELVGPDAGDHAERREDGAAEQGKGDDPARRHDRQRDHQQRHRDHPHANEGAAHDGGQHVGGEELAVADRRQQHEHDVAGDLALDERG